MPDALNEHTVYGYHIYFWSNENEPLEPIHVHVSKNPHANATKFWILSDGTLLQENNNDNIPINDLKRLVHFVSLERNIKIAKKNWVNHFGEISFKK